MHVVRFSHCRIRACTIWWWHGLSSDRWQLCGVAKSPPPESLATPPSSCFYGQWRILELRHQKPNRSAWKMGKRLDGYFTEEVPPISTLKGSQHHLLSGTCKLKRWQDATLLLLGWPTWKGTQSGCWWGVGCRWVCKMGYWQPLWKLNI